MAGTSLLFGLLFLMLGVTIWVIAAQSGVKAEATSTHQARSNEANMRDGRRRWATRRAAAVSVLAGLILFVSRTENLWILVGVSLVALAAMAAG